MIVVEDFQNILKEAGDKLVVVDFTATWCGPCKRIGPKFVEESKKPENQNVIFLKVDVDEAQDVSVHYEIRSMPTFQFYKNGVKVRLHSNMENMEQHHYLFRVRFCSPTTHH
uniref:Thioredoxin-like n=1 Tax=Labrus bergylta TaxID=56723 RepID=A0A3Q3KWN2_9LABR